LFAICRQVRPRDKRSRARANRLRSSYDGPVPDPEAKIDPLTSRQRAFLRKQAHGLKPVLQIGKGGVTEAAVTAVREALTTRELMKVKVLDVAPGTAGTAGAALAAALADTHVVQVIGRTLILYRPDPEDPQIDLPA
jgi:RNA-binding protein